MSRANWLLVASHDDPLPPGTSLRTPHIVANSPDRLYNVTMEIADAFDKHRSEPDKSLDAYLKERLLLMGQSVAHRHKVYLDTKYWLLLRDFAMGKLHDESIGRLSRLLHQGVSEAQLVCPISASTFMEISAQSDPETLRCSAQLIDTLSCGISALAWDERLRLELLYFLHRYTHGEDSCHSPHLLVWTKLVYTLGFTAPCNTPFQPHEELVMQKAFLDHMWSVSLADMIRVMGIDGFHQKPRPSRIAENLNQGKFAHAHENRTFQQMFLSELGGLLDGLKPFLRDAAIHWYAAETGNRPTAEELASSNDSQTLANMIYNLFRLGRLHTELPVIRIPATLHAAVRYDLSRRYKPTDMHDFHHAEVALPYCDTFLTEKSLKHLLTRSDLGLDRLYNCRVICDPREAVTAIERVMVA